MVWLAQYACVQFKNKWDFWTLKKILGKFLLYYQSDHFVCFADNVLFACGH